MDSATLVQLLHELGLWPEAQASQRQILEWQQQYPDARQLAGQLLKSDLLTPYQANQILTGKASALRIGPYLVLERLGEGGMGQVFKARHQKLHRIVALKVIPPDRILNEVALQRFLREVELSANLSHPNLVRAYDADKVGDRWYLAMQYIDGADLSRLVKKEGPLAIDRACDYMLQAALGLQHIERAGLVHRDIKPSNLMVTRPGSTKPASQPDMPGSAITHEPAGPWGRLKILDLGLARLQEDDRQPITQLGTVMGTADYMSPEQAIHSRDVDIRSDIYSLGCTFYFLLTGQPPFPGGNSVDKLLRHQFEDPTPGEELRPDLPVGVRFVLRKMMARKREDRYQSPAELAQALALLNDPNAPPLPLPEDDLPPSPDRRGRQDAGLIEEFAFDPDEPAAPISRKAHPDPLLDWRMWALLAASGIGVALLLGTVIRLFWR